MKSETVDTVYKATFRCIRGCPGKHELTEIVYNCRKCGGLLEVVHDIAALKTKLAGEWRRIFDERYKSHEWPFGSCVWGKKELVCPGIDDNNIVSHSEGGSDLFWAELLGHKWGLDNLWVKQLGNSHSGSFKDIGMTVLVSMVKHMRSKGKNIPAVACASTGDTSAALASYCASAGIPAIVFLPQDQISRTQLMQPLAHGAITIAINSDFDGCMKIVREITARRNIYLANSMNSLRIEGQKTIAMELLQQFGWKVPDLVVVPGGNLGNVTSIGKGLLLMKQLGLIDRLPRLCCAQAQAANPLYRSYIAGYSGFTPEPARPTLATAIRIGDPVSYPKAVEVLRQMNGIVEQATEQELAETAAEADRTGLYTCPHTAVALTAVKKLKDRGEIKSGATVVVISTATGLKFTEFKTAYLDPNGSINVGGLATPIHELPAETDTVENFVLHQLDKAG